MSEPLPALLTDPEASHCAWREDADGNWDTTCGNCFVLTEGSPNEHDMRFCCFCGLKLAEQLYTPDLDDDEPRDDDDEDIAQHGRQQRQR